MYYFLNAVIYIIVFFMGAVVFSYLNLIIERLPKHENILVRYTKCPHCDHEQRAKDVFPIISGIVYNGKCRYCREELPMRNYVNELLGGFIAIGSMFFYGRSIQAVFVFLVACDLAVISFIDMDTKEIPPQLNVIMLVMGLLSIFIMDGVGIKERLIGFVAISLPMLILAVLFNGFGGGDVKLMAAAGVLLGWKGIVIAFFIGTIIGAIYAVCLIAKKKLGRKDTFAFGPFLCLGILISWVHNFGAGIINMCLDTIMMIKTM